LNRPFSCVIIDPELLMNAIFFNEPIEKNFVGHIMAEVYKEGVYAPLLQGRKDLTIIDVGGNIGITSYYFSQFAKQVYTLEPSLEHFDVMTTMLKYNKITNVMPINKALYFKEGVFDFGGPENNGTMRSLHSATWQDGRPREQVQATTLPKLFEEFKIDHVDFMKLDVEGSETEIICSTSFKKVASKIDSMVIERHQWSGRHENQIVDALKENGFQVGIIPNQADLIYAKR